MGPKISGGIYKIFLRCLSKCPEKQNKNNWGVWVIWGVGGLKWMGRNYFNILPMIFP